MVDHFILNKKFCQPYLAALPATKLKTAVCFDLFDARFWNKESLQKPSPSGTAPVFTQTPRLWEKPTNRLTPPGWPYPNDPREGSRKKAAQKPTQTNKQPRHEVEEASNIRTEQRRKDNPKMTKNCKKKQTRTHKKTHTSRNTKTRKTQTKKTTNPRNAGKRDKLDRKKALFQTPKQQKKQQIIKQQRIPYSLKT